MAKKQTESHSSKRGNPFKRGKTWTFVYYVKDENGKRVQKWKGGYATKKEAEADLRIYRAKSELGLIKLTSDMTLKEYFDSWYPVHIKTLAPSTINSIHSQSYNHIIPALGSVKLKDLNAIIIQKFCFDLVEQKGLCASSVRKIYEILKSILNSAIENDVLTKSPCKKVVLPKSQKHRAILLSAEQLHILFRLLEGNPYEVPVKLACLHGLREGEVLGIRFQDVNFETHQLHIRKQVTTTCIYSDRKENDEPYALKDLKTESSQRTIEMSEETERLLKKQMERTLQQKELAGDTYEDNDLIFCSDNGKPFSPRKLRYDFSKVIEQCGFPHMRFHDLRHTYATLCVDLNVPLKVISQALGHSNVNITAEIYADSIKAKKELAEKISNAISSSIGSD